MELKPKFDIIYMEPAFAFLESLPEKVKDKIAYNISKSRYFMDKELFKKLNDEIWEFRTKFQGLTYRLLAFWDKDSGNLVVATHGFLKKSKKTPVKEMERAEALKREYYKNLKK